MLPACSSAWWNLVWNASTQCAFEVYSNLSPGLGERWGRRCCCFPVASVSLHVPIQSLYIFPPALFLKVKIAVKIIFFQTTNPSKKTLQIQNTQASCFASLKTFIVGYWPWPRSSAVALLYYSSVLSNKSLCWPVLLYQSYQRIACHVERLVFSKKYASS